MLRILKSQTLLLAYPHKLVESTTRIYSLMGEKRVSVVLKSKRVIESTFNVLKKVKHTKIRSEMEKEEFDR